MLWPSWWFLCASCDNQVGAFAHAWAWATTWDFFLFIAVIYCDLNILALYMMLCNWCNDSLRIFLSPTGARALGRPLMTLHLKGHTTLPHYCYPSGNHRRRFVGQSLSTKKAVESDGSINSVDWKRMKPDWVRMDLGRGALVMGMPPTLEWEEDDTLWFVDDSHYHVAS